MLSKWFRPSTDASPNVDVQVSAEVKGDNNQVLNLVLVGGHNLPLQPRKVRWNEQPQEGLGETVWLTWDSRLAPKLIGRDAELVRLREWVNSDQALSFLSIVAPGGQGKTRLAAEFAVECELRDWNTGWISLADFERADAWSWVGHWLLLVDYPEHRPEQLERLARAATRQPSQGQRLRVLLMAREATQVHEALHRGHCAGYVAPTLSLTGLLDSAGLQLLHAALARAVAEFTPGTMVPVVSASEFTAWQDQHSLHQSPLFINALALHLGLTLKSSSTVLATSQWLTGKALLQWLVEREIRVWTDAEKAQQAPSGSMVSLVGWASLIDGLTTAQVNDHLAAGYEWNEAKLDAVHRVRRAVWPERDGKPVPPMAPDLLAAQFLTHWLASDLEQGNFKRRTNLLQALLMPTSPAAAVNRLNMLAYDQTVRLAACDSNGDHSLQNWLIDASAGGSHVAGWLQEGLSEPERRDGLLNLAVVLAETSMQRVHEKDLVGKAYALAFLTFARYRAGDRAGALTPALESVAIYRRLVQANPVAHEFELAMSLNNLANCMSDTGDNVGSLAPALESVAIYRRLAQANPELHEPNLASSLNNLANCMSSAGDCTGSLALALESVVICRRLVQTNSAAYESLLAMSLNILAHRLGDSGDRAGALEPAMESVAISRRLVQTNPAAFEPHLATRLNNLAIGLRQVGDRLGALVAVKESVAIRRRLARANPAAHEPNLAGSLSNLSGSLSDIGDHAEALTLAHESVAIYRSLVQTEPSAYESDLAMSLGNLSIRLNDTGDLTGALAPMQESLSIYRRLAKTDPATYEASLAACLNDMASCLNDTGDSAEALVLAMEAVVIRRDLAEVHPEAHNPHLAMCLGSCMNSFAATGQIQQAREAGEEALRLLTTLAIKLPSVYETFRDLTAKRLQKLTSDRSTGL